MTEDEGLSSGEELDERKLERRRARANQTYKQFLKRLCASGKMSEEFAEQAAVSVLCALEQRLYGNEAQHMEAQLPLQLKNLLYRCDRHAGAVPEKFGREELLEMVGQDLGMQPDEVEPIIRAVLATVREQVSEGEIQDVVQQLPPDLRELWQLPI